MEVSKIYVDPEYRHHHIGGDALDYMLDYGREKGCKRAVLEVNPRNQAAISLYKGRGFRPVGLNMHDVGYTQIMAAFL